MALRKKKGRWDIETAEERELRRVERHEKRRDAELKRLGWGSYEEFQRDAEERWRNLGW